MSQAQPQTKGETMNMNQAILDSPQAMASSRAVCVHAGMDLRPMKITKSVKHDRLWIKASEGKSYARLGVSRSGVRVTGRGEKAREFAHIMDEAFKTAVRSGKSYGEAIEAAEEALHAIA